MDYDINRLGPREFEHLCQALFAKAAGARAGIFGDGPDGGREATYVGESGFSGDPLRPWSGYHVLQAKFQLRPTGTKSDQTWFVKQIEHDLKRWVDKSARRESARPPQYMILATNVTLTPAMGGGLDRLDDLLRQYRESIGLRDWIVWHRDSIRVLLDDAGDIRRAYAGLLAVGDILASVTEAARDIPSSVGTLLTEHALKDLRHDQYVRLSESGGDTAEKPTLDQIAVDLPIKDEQTKAATLVVRHADNVLRRSTRRNMDRHLILIGGPGQGKTTIGQIVAQVFRASMLSTSRLIDDSQKSPSRQASSTLKATIFGGRLISGGQSASTWLILERNANLAGSFIRYVAREVRAAERPRTSIRGSQGGFENGLPFSSWTAWALLATR